MRQFFSLLLLLAALPMQAQTLEDTTKFEAFDRAKSWCPTGVQLRTYVIGNQFTAFTGPSTSLKTFTLPNASATILTTNSAVTVPQGGTGGTTFMGILQGNGTGAFTAISNSSTVGQCLRVTGTNLYAWGALDLADADAVTGVLPYANGGVSTVTGRATGQTAAVASVATLTVGGADASYEVSGNILITTAGSNAFSLSVDYTDENNAAQNCIIPLVRSATGAVVTQTISASGNVPFPSVPVQIRCKASTAITIKTSGTFTGCTYNVEGQITRV